MDSVETLEELYTRKFEWLPEELGKDIGHFNLFHLEGKATSIPYRKRDFYKVMLLKGNSRVYFADKVYEIQKQALAFFHPFSQFGDYEIFQPVVAGVPAKPIKEL